MTYKDKGSYESSPPCMYSLQYDDMYSLQWYVYTIVQLYGDMYSLQWYV